MVFDVWDSMEEFRTFATTLMPILATEQIETAPAEPLQIHSLIEGAVASALRKTIEALREKAFFRRPVEKLQEKIHQPKKKSSEENPGGTGTK